MKKFFKSFSIIGLIMFVMCAVLGVGDVSGAVMSADGAAAAAAGTQATDIAGGEAKGSPASEAGTITSANNDGDSRNALATWDYRRWAPDLIKDPVEREVIQCRSYATPLDTMLSYIGSEKINNLRFKYWQIGEGTLKDTILKFVPNAAVSEDDAERSGVTGKAYIAGSHTNAVHENDNLLVAGDGDGNELYLFVQSVALNQTTTIGQDANVPVIELNVCIDMEQAEKTQAGKYQIPAIAANTDCYICGNAHNELDVTSASLEFLPTEKKGYAQIFKREITISNYAQMADKEFKWDMNEIERETVYRWKKEKEMAFLFGRMSRVFDKNGKEVLRTAGVFRTILAWQKKNPRDGITYINGAIKVNSAAAKPEEEFVDMMKAIFVGNNGNTERFAFAGPSAIAKLSKMMAKGIQKNQDADKTDIVAGITFTKIVSKFGVINLIYHPLFEETPYKDYILIIDPQFLKKKEVLPVDRQEVDGREHLIVNGKIVILSETSGVAVYNPEAHKVVKLV